MNKHETLTTREKLIEAAGKLFGEKGFSDTSIREICKDADVNIASIHYHFGDKAKLYKAVVLSIFDTPANRNFLKDPGNPSDAPDIKLYKYIYQHLEHRLTMKMKTWQRNILLKEFDRSDSILTDHMIQVIEKKRNQLEAIIVEFLGEEEDDLFINLCMDSVIGQIQYYHPQHIVAKRFQSELINTPDGVKKLARYITEFSTKALLAFRDERKL